MPGDNAWPAFLVVDTESVPDGPLLSAVKYPGEGLSPDEAVAKAQAEAREQHWKGSDFLPVTFQVPVAVCVLRVGANFALQSFACLDAPQFRPREIVAQFWRGFGLHNEKRSAKLVTFNGRGFDLPLLELAAFRHGVSAKEHFLARDRYRGPIDLMEWFTNFGAYRMTGGLDLAAKAIGLPGKIDIAGDQVYRLHRDGKLREINDYCLCDALDTYFVFLRTRVMTGDVDAEQEADLVAKAKAFLRSKSDEYPVLGRYLEAWASRG